MTEIVTPGQGILFMKVGTHAQESLEEIIVRKTKEIEDEGFALWGYGGNTCHPRTMVQPFAETVVERGGVIYLCMQPMESHHFGEKIRAKDWSADGLGWNSVPDGINVLGSRFALVIKHLRQEEFTLPLSRTRVAIGRSMGRAGSKYLKGQVDKACLVVTPGGEMANVPDHMEVNIGLVAELISPYAVFVR